MSLLSRLRDLVHELVDPDEASPDFAKRVTVAAFLAVVARVDGRVLPVEQQGLKTLLQVRFGLTEESTERLLDHIGEMEAELDQATGLIDRLLVEVEPRDRAPLLAMAYRVAALDGFVHEFEDDLAWRVGRHLGFDDAAIAAIREAALRSLAPERARLA
ncbi:MAG TPA: TerB family tellurite resistance protein [Microvirga sp.]|jgi:uncharacterized tellurite resistance protein B-like protein|nr:TerB family tellurite resistance protein [Microvirga sp.]